MNRGWMPQAEKPLSQASPAPGFPQNPRPPRLLPPHGFPPAVALTSVPVPPCGRPAGPPAHGWQPPFPPPPAATPAPWQFSGQSCPDIFQNASPRTPWHRTGQ